ncbi:hypothetical protein BwSH20_64250 [Bradyrhizobium ottawaense]|nr:hypothetical protein BwSG20_53090 [Bradyrhizobium ottawaense]GMP10871.1 hypothetical protein BwSH20_64250 [Bradyrhizobium ottawaense]
MRNLIGGAGSTKVLPHHRVEHKKADGDGNGQQWENVVHAPSKALKILASECELSNRTKFPGLRGHFESRLYGPDPLVILIRCAAATNGFVPTR